MAIPVCGRFGLWPFRFVTVPVCGHFGLWSFRSVAVPVCGRFGLWPFRFWPFRFVVVMTRIRYIDHICVKKMEFIASYLEITCVYCILLDYLDLQSCQVGQGKDVAITTPAQSTLCTLGHQAVPRLASGLDSMWHISTNGF